MSQSAAKPFEYMAWLNARQAHYDELLPYIGEHRRQVQQVVDRFFREHVMEFGVAHEVDQRLLDWRSEFSAPERERFLAHERESQIHRIAEMIFKTGAYTQEVIADRMRNTRTTQYRVLCMNFGKLMGPSKEPG